MCIRDSSETFTLTITPVNDAPALTSIGDQTTAEDTPLTITLEGSDIDEDALSYSAVSDNEDVSVSVVDAELTFTSSEDYNGTASVTVTVSDGFLTDTETFTLTITPVNDAPALTSIGDQTTAEDLSLIHI